MKNFHEFCFDSSMLATPRKPGISAYMRIKNEEDFVRLAILSHIDFYDEIVACYNDCTDNTEAILLELAEQHPDKIKVYHYLPKVHPCRTKEHAETPGDSVHSFANHSNYALSKTTYSVAVKLDADHIAIPCKLAPVINKIRKDIIAGKQKIYYFSGINLMRDGGNQTGIISNLPFSGHGDHAYHPVNPTLFYTSTKEYEQLFIKNKSSLEREYMGIMYFHLKYLKKNFSLGIYRTDIETAYMNKRVGKLRFVSFAEFCSRRNHKEMKKQFNPWGRFWCTLYTRELIRKTKYKLTGRHPSLRKARLARLATDLHGINLQCDVLDRVENPHFEEFRFVPSMLAAPRKPGISAYMRIKNEEQLVRLAILSHIDFYDEIIACYNDCSDNTEAILYELAEQYPNKLKVYHYLPKVHPALSEAHAQTPDDSVYGLANYYNWALSKTTYSVATKLDADHLAIPHKLAPLIATIRRDIAAGKKKIYMFSGLNLMRGNDSIIGVIPHYFPRAVGGAVINDDQLKVSEGLRGDARHRFAEIFFGVERGQDDGDGGGHLRLLWRG